MNYWQRWIGAWKKKTAALTLAERGAYTEMLDAYYANEGPLPAHDESLFRIVGAMTKAEQEAVCKVRYNKEFFTERDGKLHNERADSEIARWSAFCDQQRQRRIGNAPPPRKPRVNGAHRADNLTGFDAFYAAYPRHTGRLNAEKAWKKLAPDQELQTTLLAAVAKQKASEQWHDPQFIPHPATWLTGKRWNDVIATAGERDYSHLVGKED